MFPLYDDVPRLRPPLIVVGLILANLLVQLFQFGLGEEDLLGFIRHYGLVPRRITDPAWAARAGNQGSGYGSFLSHMFLHADLLHLVGNMWMLWIFGDNVEDRMGHLRFLLFYLGCGLAAALVQFLTGPASMLPMIGASGAVAGVMGAYLLLYPHARVVVLVLLIFIPYFFVVPAFLFLGLWALLQFLIGTMSIGAPADLGGVAFWAHVGGFAAGMLLHRPLLRPDLPAPTGRVVLRRGLPHRGGR